MKVARSETANRIGPATSSGLPTRWQRANPGGELEPLLGFQERRGHIRLDETGRNAIHQDIVAREFQGEALGEADDGALRGGIMRAKRRLRAGRPGADGKQSGRSSARSCAARKNARRRRRFLKFTRTISSHSRSVEPLDRHALGAVNSGARHQDIDSAQPREKSTSFFASAIFPRSALKDSMRVPCFAASCATWLAASRSLQ